MIAAIVEYGNDCKLYLYDSYRIFQSPLKDIGKAVGIEKKEIDYQNIMEDDRLDEYLYTDNLILYTAITKLEEVLDELQVQLKPTAASTAMDTFLRVYLNEPFRTEIDGSQWLKPYYCGGRVECFQIGEFSSLYAYDVNSMYPYVMKHYKFPIGEAYEIDSNAKWYLNKCSADGKYVGFFYCRLDLPQSIEFPILPLKYDNKLLFPVGKFEGWYDGIEVLKLLEICNEKGLNFDSICEISRAKLYNAKALFAEYVDAFYAMKQRGGIYKIAAKLFLNSLYGKFGEGLIKKAYFLNPTIGQIERSSKGAELALDVPEINLWYIETERLPKHVSIPIAAHVTACARIELYGWIQKANTLGAQVYYCDTDSIFVDREIFKSSDKLGELKLEGAYNKALIYGPKLYALTAPKEGYSEKVKAKGFRRLTIGEFESLVKDKASIRIQGGLSQFKSIVAETKRLFKNKRSKYINHPLDIWVLEYDKTIRSDYAKRTLLAGGKTEPIEITKDMKDFWKMSLFRDLAAIAKEEK